MLRPCDILYKDCCKSQKEKKKPCDILYKDCCKSRKEKKKTKTFVFLLLSCSSPLTYSPTSPVGLWRYQWTAPSLWRRQEQHTLGWATTKTQAKSSSHSDQCVHCAKYVYIHCLCIVYIRMMFDNTILITLFFIIYC